MFPELQRGFALVSAIFLLVVLAALGGFIAVVTSAQHTGAAQDVQGAQVLQAANAGIEWGLYQTLKSSACAATSSFHYPVGNIDVTVTCVSQASGEAGGGTLYTLTATACLPGNAAACPGDTASPNYIERQVRVVADSTPPP